jgi:hypothetical protein
VRSFNGCSRETEDIKDALLNRYRASTHEGLLGALEPDALASRLELAPQYAHHLLFHALAFPPVEHDLFLRLTSTSGEGALREVEEPEEGAGAAPPFEVLSSDGWAEAPQPEGFLLALRAEQCRSLAWMLAQEARPRRLKGERTIDVKVALPPVEAVSARWRMRAEYWCRGGVLADTIGFGKTAVSLALVASGRPADRSAAAEGPEGDEERPAGSEAAERRSGERKGCEAKTRAGGAMDEKAEVCRDKRGLLRASGSLVVVPPHLLGQWQAEAVKFAGASLKVRIVHPS